MSQSKYKAKKQKTKKPRRFRSLQRQITLIFIIVLLFSILLISLLNGFFLEKYYISQKTNVLIKAKESLNSLDIDTLVDGTSEDTTFEFYFGEEEDTTEDYEDDINIAEEPVNADEAFYTALDEMGRFSSRNNLSWVVINRENSSFYAWGENDKMLRGKLFGYVYNLDSSESRIIKKSDDCVVQQVSDRFAGMDYVECWGALNSDYYFLIRTPLESITESVQISNRFYFFVGALVTAVSALILALLIRRLTRPIKELTVLSKRMASLDFEERYKSDAGNEIDVLGDSFNKMSDELERTISELKTANLELQKDIENKIEIDKRRKEFLDNVSHELKTPIALIQGYAEGLKDNISDDPDSREFYCEVIMDEAQKMNKLVKNLLTLNQLESGKDPVVMERFDLVSVIRGVLQNMDIMLQQSGAEVVFEENAPVYVWADEFKVEEVVTNYTSNAIHHLGGEKKIVIRLLKEDGKVRVSVFNTGTPIPEEDIPNLWQKFYKVDKARTREYGGSGIGLSIVKAIMEGMQQEYGVTNFENGVEFWFTLDLK
ncbi:MAG: HAMP domain-containing protein [Blautia sp.]|nr:HAMP domain-containing protein [Blautia sp.]